MTLRRLQPLGGEDLHPRRIVGSMPELVVVDARDVYVDETYQRDIQSKRSRELIAKIARNWSWHKFKPPILVMSDGHMCAIDGQHTTTGALSRGDVTQIPALLHRDVSLEQAAQAFIGHNRDNLRVTPVQIFFAALAIDDADAVLMKRVCDQAGVRILRSPTMQKNCKPGDMHVFGLVQQLLKNYGEEGVLELLTTAVHGQATPISAVLLRALEYLRFGAECRGDWNAEIYSVLIRNFGQRLEIEARAKMAENELSKIHEGMALFMYQKRLAWRTP